MIQIKMVQPGTGIQQEGRKELERHQKGNIIGRKMGIESFCPLTHIKYKRGRRSEIQIHCIIHNEDSINNSEI
jgi:hypothetical protein